MNIFVQVSGPISDGLDSPTRGEGRWCLNMARCLADAGHKVLISTNGGECLMGGSVKHPNVGMIQWRDLRLIQDHVFDVYFTVNHIPGSPFPVKSNIVLSGAYSLGGLILEPEVSRVQDEVYTLASGRTCHDSYSKSLAENGVSWSKRYKLLCQPYGKELGKSKFNNKTIIFSAKEVFHPTLTRLHEDAKRNIFAAVDACKETGSKFLIISAEWNDPLYKTTIEKLGIFDKLNEVANVRRLQIIPWKHLMNELAGGSIFIPLGFAGCTPDALFSGLVPLLRKDIMLVQHPDLDTKKIVDEMGDSLKHSQDEIKETLVRLLTDEDHYNYFQKELQKIMVDHLDASVLKQFYDILEYDKNRTDK